MTAGFWLILVAHPGMLLPNVTLDKPVPADIFASAAPATAKLGALFLGRLPERQQSWAHLNFP